MKKNKKDSLFLVILTLIIVVIGLGIAFATFSRTLTINGSATVNSSTWNVHFSSTSGGPAGGTITPVLDNIEGLTPTATASVGTFNATQLNSGDYDAKLSSLTKSALTCKVNDAPETAVCSKISYIFRYKDGSTINPTDVLGAGQSKEVELILQLGSLDGIDLPTDNVVIDSDTLTITMLYVQN